MSIDATITFTREHDVDVKLAYLSSLQNRRMPIMLRITELDSIIIIIIVIIIIIIINVINYNTYSYAASRNAAGRNIPRRIVAGKNDVLL